MSLLEKAIHLACNAHAGQLDKAGQPYILHPLRLMMKVSSEPAQIVAILHDVVEDTDINLQQLKSLGFAEDVIQAIDCLTKREGEEYDNFIERISKNKLATQVKIQDIQDNLDLTRLSSINDKDLERAKKYHQVLRYLQNKV
ncbi:MAG: GTP pyrophosphokinase [Cellvibrio sp.]